MPGVEPSIRVAADDDHGFREWMRLSSSLKVMRMSGAVINSRRGATRLDRRQIDDHFLDDITKRFDLFDDLRRAHPS